MIPATNFWFRPVEKIQLLLTGYRFRKWAFILRLVGICRRMHWFNHNLRVWYLLMIILNFFRGHEVLSQPNRQQLRTTDTTDYHNSNDQKVVPLFRRTDDRNPIKQVLGIDFGQLILNRITKKDSLTLISLGIKLDDTSLQINTLNDLIKTFHEIFNTSLDSFNQPKDTAGSPEDQFHFVSIQGGIALSGEFSSYHHPLLNRRRKD
jgi:hypothetical protein